jgi:O-antigen/teichoic acid export membrane protein
MSSIKKNFSYNILYQILTTILPLITAPYIARVIGVDGVGINSYVYSIVSYFMLFCMLGLNNYGNREISRCRDNFETRSKTFWQIYYMQLILSVLVITIYFIFVFFLLKKEYRFFATISAFYLFGCMFDVNWFFFGMEQFKTTVVRNCIIKLTTFVLTFLLIKEPTDLWKYMLLLAVSSFASQIILWFFLKKYVVYIKPKFNDIIKHIKPNLILFLPVLAISLYEIMDKIMLGYISGTVQTGLYESAYKIVKMPGLIFTALGTVMLPRISNLVAKKENDAANAYIRDSLQFTVFLSCGMAFGIIAIASRFIPFFYGPGYEESILLLQCLAPVLILSSWKSVLRTQCLIPRGKDRSYIISVFLGAIINLIINGVLIPKIGSLGAAIGTIAAELCVCIYQTYAVKDLLPLSIYFKDNWSFVISGIAMIGCLELVQRFLTDSIKSIIEMVLIGALIYCVIGIGMMALTNKQRLKMCYSFISKKVGKQ